MKGLTKILKEVFNENLLKKIIYNKKDFLRQFLVSENLVCLDIGSYSLKVFEFQQVASGVLLKTAVYQEIPDSTQKERDFSDNEFLSGRIAEIWQKHNIKGKNVRLIISDPSVYIRHIQIPKINEHELKKAIRWQAEKFVPFAIEEASVDYEVVENSKEVEGKIEVIIVVVDKAVIDKYLDIMRAAKLTPVLLDVAPFAAARAVAAQYASQENKIVPVIDIGHRMTFISLVKGNALLFVRSVEVSGYHMTRAIEEKLMVGQQEAEKVKKQCNVSEKSFDLTTLPGKAGAALEPVLEELVKQVNRSLAYCEGKDFGGSISKIILCGGGSQLSGIDKYLSQQLGCAVERANSWQRNLAKDLPEEHILNEAASLFLTALGGVLSEE